MPVADVSFAASDVLRLDIAADLLALLHDTATEPRPDTQLEALTLAVCADLPVLLWGEPGIGKTAALNQLAQALDLPSRRRSWIGPRWRSWPGCGCMRSHTCCATTTAAATGSRWSAD